MNTRFGYQALGLFQTEEELDNYPAAPTGTKKPRRPKISGRQW